MEALFDDLDVKPVAAPADARPAVGHVKWTAYRQPVPAVPVECAHCVKIAVDRLWLGTGAYDGIRAATQRRSCTGDETMLLCAEHAHVQRRLDDAGRLF